MREALLVTPVFKYFTHLWILDSSRFSNFLSVSTWLLQPSGFLTKKVTACLCVPLLLALPPLLAELTGKGLWAISRLGLPGGNRLWRWDSIAQFCSLIFLPVYSYFMLEGSVIKLAVASYKLEWNDLVKLWKIVHVLHHMAKMFTCHLSHNGVQACIHITYSASTKQEIPTVQTLQLRYLVGCPTKQNGIRLFGWGWCNAPTPYRA